MTAANFIVRVSSICNLECHYCFARPDFQGRRMSQRMLERVIREIDSMGLNSVQMAWHGGEPLMLGIDLFEYGVELQSSLKTAFCNTVQTNGVLIDDAYADFFAEHDFQVGISIDGYEEVHNVGRPFINGKGSFDQVIKGLHRLRKKGLEVSCISVITDFTDPDEYFQFIKDLDVCSFAMKPCSGNWEHALNFRQYSDFVRKVHRLVASSDADNPICREFMGYAANILSGANVTDLCSQSGKCGEFAMVDVNGDVFPCDELATEEFLWGNITEKPLKDILESPERQRFLQHVSSQNDACQKECDVFDACQGGCTSCHLHFRKDEYCSALGAIIGDIRQMVGEGIKSWVDVADDATRRLIDPKLLD